MYSTEMSAIQPMGTIGSQDWGGHQNGRQKAVVPQQNPMLLEASTPGQELRKRVKLVLGGNLAALVQRTSANAAIPIHGELLR